jgi:hypothetical protein
MACGRYCTVRCRWPEEREEELQEAISEESVKGDKILLHDGREREILRPQDDEARELKYSGKKKRHAVKNAVVIRDTGRRELPLFSL